MMIENKLCPVCRNGKSIPFGQQEWQVDGDVYHLMRCQACGSIFTTPPPEDSTLANLYKTAFDFRWYQDHYDAKLRDVRLRIQEFGSKLGKRVLDFGGGVGYFSAAARDAGLHSVTYDPWVKTNTETAETNAWESVVALHVLEHSNDPAGLLRAMSDHLKENGNLVLAVPNASGLGYRTHGMSWVWSQPPLIHIFHFTADGLHTLLTEAGFEVISTSYHDRWDANYHADVLHSRRQRLLDSLWGLKPLNRFGLYRRAVATVVCALRRRSLRRSNNAQIPEADRAELLIIARKRATK
jgi:hypothetical protein